MTMSKASSPSCPASGTPEPHSRALKDDVHGFASRLQTRVHLPSASDLSGQSWAQRLAHEHNVSLATPKLSEDDDRIHSRER